MRLARAVATLLGALTVLVGACGTPAATPPTTPASTAGPPRDAPSSPTSSAPPEVAPGETDGHVSLLLSVAGVPRCVGFSASTPQATASLVTTAATGCRRTTLTLQVAGQRDAGLRLVGAALHSEEPHSANAAGMPGGATEQCVLGASARELRTYASPAACEAALNAARGGSAARDTPLSTSLDSCVQAFVNYAFAPDPRLARVNDAALVHALDQRGSVVMMMRSKKGRICAEWAIENEGPGAQHGRLTRSFTRDGARVTWSRSYAYDALCKSFGLSGFAQSTTRGNKGSGSATSDICSVVGLLERATPDSFDVARQRLFLTEAACKAALSATVTPADANEAKPYLASEEGC